MFSGSLLVGMISNRFKIIYVHGYFRVLIEDCSDPFSITCDLIFFFSCFCMSGVSPVEAIEVTSLRRQAKLIEKLI